MLLPFQISRRLSTDSIGRILSSLLCFAAFVAACLPAQAQLFETKAAHAYMIDADTGSVLFSKDPDALMLLMPLSGWVMVSTGRTLRPLNWFGLFDVPYLSLGAGSHGIADTSHMLLGYLFAALVVLHIAAALRHHFLLRDTTLVRMMPGPQRG